jgi:hypothetical protein
VRGVSVALFDDALVIRVDLYEDDSLGIYRYITSLIFQGARLLVFLDPLRNSAQLSYDTGQTWEDLAQIGGCQFGEFARTVFAIVPVRLWLAYVNHATLEGSRIGFELDYIEGRRRELFFFGSGVSVPVPTVYTGSAFSGMGS